MLRALLAIDQSKNDLAASRDRVGRALEAKPQDSERSELDAEVKLRDGRLVSLQETAVHDVRDGKIVSERYYYNPMALAPPPPSS